ncbi:hypothetical protein COCNU_14G006890 [Cocos nucifera]|uniref:Secreted protein n=1 Tax=Cocos nucifera TaxID=13894 RepID=A0A8K0IV31_COCNU|nr:hypothetical protein COCNU_14G006890 [Cocos nucifera]
MLARSPASMLALSFSSNLAAVHGVSLLSKASPPTPINHGASLAPPSSLLQLFCFLPLPLLSDSRSFRSSRPRRPRRRFPTRLEGFQAAQISIDF